MFPKISIKGNSHIYKDSILNFISTFNDAVFLDSNNETGENIPFTGIKYRYIAAAGISEEVHAGLNNLAELNAFVENNHKQGSWVFGFLSYDLKNELEQLNSSNPDHTGFPVFHFFSARHVFVATDEVLTIIDADDPQLLWEKINSNKTHIPDSEKPGIRISHVLNRDNYIDQVKKLLQHIQQGNIYEINYCHQITARAVSLEPLAVFKKLTAISPNPFSCYYRTRGLHLMCASPERFLAKRGQTLIAQPIKGSAARGITDAEDIINKNLLGSIEKERSENIMIVDLVRNDLSKIAETGSVKVQELCGIYTFPKIHQMISTITCSLKADADFVDIIQALFPMGSMTGAPKLSAMKLIDEHENFKRTLFSGTVGYINPVGDFDFNVVIRSILYNENLQAVSIAAGSAITAASDPEKEYNETLVKLSPQLEAVGIATENLFKV